MTAPDVRGLLDIDAEAAYAALVAFDALPSNVKDAINAQHPRYCYVRGWAAAIAAHVAPPVSASFDAALAGLDVENDYAPDRGTTYAIVGIDDVRAAHWAEVDAAVAAKEEAEGANILNRNAVARLSARVAKLEAALECYEILDSYGLTPTDPRWASVGEDGAMSMLRARGVNAGSLGDSYAIVRAKARAALEDPK